MTMLPDIVALRAALVCETTVPAPEMTIDAPWAVPATEIAVDVPTMVDDDRSEITAVVIEPPTRMTSYADSDVDVAAVKVKDVADPLIATAHDVVAAAALQVDETALMTAEETSPTTLIQCAVVDVMVELVERIVNVDVVPNSIPVVDVVRLDEAMVITMLFDDADADGDNTNPPPPVHDTVEEPMTTVSWRVDAPATLITVDWVNHDDEPVIVSPTFVTTPPTMIPLPTETVLACVIRKLDDAMLPATLTIEPVLCV
jgi:hypothetical protein